MCVSPTASRSTGLKTTATSYVYTRGFRGSTERPSYSFTTFKDLNIGDLHERTYANADTRAWEDTP